MIRCESCYELVSKVDRDSTGTLACEGCFVPDIHDPSWKGYRAATEDVLVAPPNAKNVTPRVLSLKG